MKVVILAGGSGTRLFPLSRQCLPKQFINIAGDKTLLGRTVKRFLGNVEAKDIIVVTNKDFQFIVQDILHSENADAAHILLEPVGRNTAPAIALTIAYCLDVLHAAKDEVMFVVPSDHVISPQDVFVDIIKQMQDLAVQGQIVTMGIKPSKPETGYGYIHVNGNKVLDFKEKPTLSVAQEYVADGNYYWNGGIFAFRMDVMGQELNKYAPEIAEMAAKGYGYLEEHFADMPHISIDYAVAEKTDRIGLVPFVGNWNDVGSWDAVADVYQKDDRGNICDGDVALHNTDNTMVVAKHRLVMANGVSDLNIVETGDVVYVGKKGCSQDVKVVFEQLQKQNRRELKENVTIYRPWGNYTCLTEGDGFKVKKIVVKPGQSLSLQSHAHRSEHWTVVAGVATISIGDKTFEYKVNEGTYIPVGTKHRLQNKTTGKVVIIEVQTGDYLGEDDIIRYDDIYGRVK